MKEKRSYSDFSYRSAVGLAYQPDRGTAPIVNITGEDIDANEIVKIARRFGVPVVEQPSLCDALKGYELEQEIPRDLYEPVALILNELDRKKK